MADGTRAGLLATLVVALAGCGMEPASADPAFIVRDSAGIRLVENRIPEVAPTCQLAGPLVTIGETAGREDYELYRVFGARRLSDGRIAVVNQGSQELRFYDADGVFLSRAGRGGEGPGEFRDAFYLWVTVEDSVWVGDYRPWQFHVFDPAGAWVRTVRPSPPMGNPPALMTVLADGRTVLAERDASSTANFEPRSAVPVIRDPNGAVLDTVGVYPHGRWGQVGDDPQGPYLFPLFESFTQLDGFGSRWYLGHGSTAEIAVFGGASEAVVEALVRWTTSDLAVQSSDVDAERARLRAEYPDLDPAMARRLVEPLVSDERPVAETFPVFNDVVANRAGGFWVREYRRPGTSPYTWLSFDADGFFQCRVTLPDVELVDLGEDYVLVEEESVLGVEQIAMYRVGAPPN